MHTDIHVSNNYTLLDSAIFVHVFYNKEKFLNFKKSGKGFGLKYGNSIIFIERWGEIILSLKVKNSIKLLIFKQKTYIAKFLGNLIFWEALSRHEFNWKSQSKEIQNLAKQIIDYTIEWENKYHIGKIKKLLKAAMATLATNLNTWSYHIVFNKKPKTGTDKSISCF